MRSHRLMFRSFLQICRCRSPDMFSATCRLLFVWRVLPLPHGVWQTARCRLSPDPACLCCEFPPAECSSENNRQADWPAYPDKDHATDVLPYRLVYSLRSHPHLHRECPAFVQRTADVRSCCFLFPAKFPAHRLLTVWSSLLPAARPNRCHFL